MYMVIVAGLQLALYLCTAGHNCHNKMPIMDTSCTLSSHSQPGALLSGGADKAPDHNCQERYHRATRGSVIYLVGSL